MILQGLKAGTAFGWEKIGSINPTLLSLMPGLCFCRAAKGIEQHKAKHQGRRSGREGALPTEEQEAGEKLAPPWWIYGCMVCNSLALLGKKM